MAAVRKCHMSPLNGANGVREERALLPGSERTPRSARQSQKRRGARASRGGLINAGRAEQPWLRRAIGRSRPGHSRGPSRRAPSASDMRHAQGGPPRSQGPPLVGVTHAEDARPLFVSDVPPPLSRAPLSSTPEAPRRARRPSDALQMFARARSAINTRRLSASRRRTLSTRQRAPFLRRPRAATTWRMRHVSVFIDDATRGSLDQSK